MHSITQRPASGAWSETCVPDWQVQTLPGKKATLYSLAAEDGVSVVRAKADRSASLMRHRLRIEPDALGSLRFSWRVSSLIASADVRERDSEDAPARLVLAFDGDHATLGARDRMLFDLAESLSGERPPFATLMYVWDSSAPVETVVMGARTGRIRKIVVDSGPDQLGAWRSHERDIAADYRRAFGEPPGPLIAVALMTDADNTQTRASATYGPVCFTGIRLGGDLR